MKAPILTHYKQGLKIIMETDFFDYVNNGVFFCWEKIGC